VAHLDTQLQPIRLREGLWQRLLQLRGASSPDELLHQLGLSEAELQELIDHQLLRPPQGRIEAGPLQARSRLRLPPGVQAALLSDPHRLQVGTALMELEKAEDLRWAESLLSRRHGFTVLEAAGWAHLPPGEARARLQRLVEAGVLEGA
jgi:hypothetical protein